ncbi:MAG: aminoacyl-tRNA hydrolase [bacterium]
MGSFLLVGLGNPEPRYETTRHNIGFMAIDSLAARLGISLTQQKFHGRYASGLLRGEKLHLVQPLTYMNLSGKSVVAARSFFDVDMEHVIVAHDDLDLPPGAVRVKAGGGHGGHNGLRDIIAKTGKSDFVRVRLGIGRPEKGSVTDWVLNPFSKDEIATLETQLEEAADAIEMVITDGVVAAQNKFNGKS